MLRHAPSPTENRNKKIIATIKFHETPIVNRCGRRKQIFLLNAPLFGGGRPKEIGSNGFVTLSRPDKVIYHLPAY
jgi:hypothetical protein